MGNKWVILIIIILVIAGIFFFNKNIFNKDKAVIDNNENKLQVTTSIYPIYFFATEIAGDKADVFNLTPAGSEPHDFDLSIQDIADIENGDMIILNGGVESWGVNIIENLKDTKVKIVVAGDGLITKNFTNSGSSLKDPHIWLDPNLAKKEIDKIARAFIEIDTKNSDFYKNNQNTLNNKLDELNTGYNKGLSNCKSRDFITSHAAFAYLADAFDLNQIAISGLSPDTEPSAQQLTEVIEFAKKTNTKYIFFEKLVSPKLSETIANEVGAKTLVLDPLEGLSDDELRSGNNYFTVMRDNLKNLQEALSCIN